MSERANFADIYLRGMRDRSMRSGTELAREIQANFDHAMTGAIYFIFHKGKIVFRSSKLHISSSFSLEDFCQEKKQKRNSFSQTKFVSVTSIQFVACALRENLSNRSSGVQIPRVICTRFGRYCPRNFGPEAKTRGGILGFPACIHIRNFKM